MRADPVTLHTVCAALDLPHLMRKLMELTRETLQNNREGKMKRRILRIKCKAVMRADPVTLHTVCAALDLPHLMRKLTELTR
jgi:hypothetical protein